MATSHRQDLLDLWVTERVLDRPFDCPTSELDAHDHRLVDVLWEYKTAAEADRARSSLISPETLQVIYRARQLWLATMGVGLASETKPDVLGAWSVFAQARDHLPEAIDFLQSLEGAALCRVF